MSEEISTLQHEDSLDISEAERELIPSEGYIVDHITGEKLVKDTPKDVSELRPRASVEATSCDRLAVNENIFMRSEI